MPSLSAHEKKQANKLIDSLLKAQNEKCFPDQLPELKAETIVRFLLESVLASEGHDGYGFPFDRPKLGAYRRLINTALAMKAICTSTRLTAKEKKQLRNIPQPFVRIAEDSNLAAAAKQLEQKIDIFEELRQLLKLAPVGGNQGLNHPGLEPSESENMNAIEQTIKDFRDKLDVSCPLQKKLQEQLDRHWKGLFRPPIKVHTSARGSFVIHPQRTNNIMEHLFRSANHAERRRTGTEFSSARLDATLPQSLLIRNLKDPEYLKLILDGSPDLTHRFSCLDPDLVRESIEATRSESSCYEKPRFARQVMIDSSTTKILAQYIIQEDLEVMNSHDRKLSA